MKKSSNLFFVAFIGLIFLSSIFINAKFDKIRHIFKADMSYKGKVTSSQHQKKMTYNVKLGRLDLGKAVLYNMRTAEIEGKQLNVAVFETDVVRFKDVEKIYSDPDTFLPVKIDREVFGWLKSEKITENYDQDNFTLTITKEGGSKDNKTVIKKDGPIHNAILLPYYAKDIFKFELGNVFNVNLPNRNLQIKLVSIEDVEVPAGTFKAYHFESTPKQIDIWISQDERKIPLKMQGMGAIGYSLVLNDSQQLNFD
jgi:hypothetical protein